MVGTDSTAGVLESFLRDGISLEHDAVPRAYRQDIRSHRVELPVRNLDEIEPEFFQSRVKGGRQKPRIDDSQILVDEADQRHQMEASLWSLVGRERDDPFRYESRRGRIRDAVGEQARDTVLREAAAAIILSGGALHKRIKSPAVGG